MTPKRSILITGLSGFLGRALTAARPAEDHIVGTTRSFKNTTLVEQIASWRECNLEDRQAVDDCIRGVKPTVVIHAAGEANVDNAQASPSGAIASNVVSTINLAQACASRGIHLIFVSSNAVFSGNEAPYDEMADPNPVNHYGLIKLTAERAALHLNPKTTIVRPILMYGWNDPTGRSNPVLTTINKLRAGEPIKMVDDVYENPLYGRECAKAIWAIARDGKVGTYHVAGSTTVHRYDLALQTARVFELDENLITRVQSDAFPSIAPRPKNTSFITDRMQRELGIEPLSLEHGLRLMREHEA